MHHLLRPTQQCCDESLIKSVIEFLASRCFQYTEVLAQFSVIDIPIDEEEVIQRRTSKIRLILLVLGGEIAGHFRSRGLDHCHQHVPGALAGFGSIIDLSEQIIPAIARGVQAKTLKECVPFLVVSWVLLGQFDLPHASG